jgi:hypothetical protein
MELLAISLVVIGSLVFVATILGKPLAVTVTHVSESRREEVKYIPVELTEEETRQARGLSKDPVQEALSNINKMMYDLED